MSEEWRVAPSAPEFDVSSLGRLRRKGRILKGSKWSTGYIYVQTTIGATAACGKRALGLHVLVCEAFHGPRPFFDSVPCHRDGTRDNNAAENLRWGSPKENAADRRAHGRDRLGVDHHGAKLIDEHEVLAIFALSRRGLIGEEIARCFGISAPEVNRILARKAWTHVTIPETLGTVRAA
ncbi:HNH endonuclease signature motif containing protein [Methylobacterium hispanicum]|uniref:HNH endonuclease signature motif containing protein n=1 Tax=Methylobacterium hispanicum TaxID=270350 RepID=UPI002F2CAE00